MKYRTGLAVAIPLAGIIRAGAVALLATVCLPMSAAMAATITETVAFTATGFGGFPDLTGSFTITFDPTSVHQTGTLDAFSSNLPSGYGTVWDFVYGSGALQIGDHCGSTSCNITSPGNDTADVIFSSVTALGGIMFSSAEITTNIPVGISLGGDFTTRTGTATVTPLPAALPLFATGLAGLGLLGWRRKRKAQAV